MLADASSGVDWYFNGLLVQKHDGRVPAWPCLLRAPEQPSGRAISCTASSLRIITRISAPFFEVNIDGQETVSFAQMGQIYFGAVEVRQRQHPTREPMSSSTRLARRGAGAEGCRIGRCQGGLLAAAKIQTGPGRPVRGRARKLTANSCGSAAKVSLGRPHRRPGSGHERVLPVDRFVTLWRFRTSTANRRMEQLRVLNTCR